MPFWTQRNFEGDVVSVIWIRRLIALPVLVMVIVIFQTAVFTQQATSKLISTTFYLEIFEESDTYTFIVTDLSNSVLEDIRRESQNPLIEESGLSNELLTSSIEKIIPPEWIQINFEANIEEIKQFVMGSDESFEISIPLNERSQATEDQISYIVKNTDLHKIIFENEVRPFAKEGSKTKLPFNVTISEDELMEFITRVLSEEWALKQTHSILLELTPYAVGKHDDFKVVIRVEDRIDVAISEIKSILATGNAYDVFFEKSISPSISTTIGDVAKLPHEVNLTDKEISILIEKAAPDDWRQEVTESILDGTTPYLAGHTDEFSISIDITPNKENAVDSLMDLAEQKLNEKLEILPKCDADAIAYILGGTQTRFPSCFPKSTTLREEMQDYRETLVNEVISAIRPRIVTKIPDSVEFNQNSLRNSMPLETWNSFEKGRLIVKDGYKFTQSDLENIVKEKGDLKSWDQFIFLRESISQGIHYTDEDFLTHMANFDDAREQILFRIDQFRGIHRTIKDLDVLLYLTSLFLAILVGLLMGRRWVQRLKWAATAILIASLLVYLVWGPIYSILMEPILQGKIEKFLIELINPIDSRFLSTKYVFSEQLVHMSEIALSKFVSGIAKTALIVSIFATAFVVGCTTISKLDLTARQK